MIEFNDSNADVTKNGYSIFFNPIDTNEDVFIGSTCIFMEDFKTSGNLKVQYSLTVHGTLTVDGLLTVGEDLTCIALEANDVDIERNLSVRGDISVKRIFIGGDADIGNIFAQSVTSYGNIFVRSGMDIQGDIEARMAIMSIDYISVSGVLRCSQAISENIDAGDNQVGNTAIIQKAVSISSPTSGESEQQRSLIAESEINDIYDGKSSLAIGMEDCALFIEKLNEGLCKMEPTSSDLCTLLEAYGGFMPTYLELFEILEDSLSVVNGNFAGDSPSLKELLTCGQALLQFPDWFRHSTVAKRYTEQFKTILESLIDSKIRTKSRSEWMQGLGLIQHFKDQYPEDGTICHLLDELSDMLFGNSGLKPLTVKLYLPEN